VLVCVGVAMLSTQRGSALVLLSSQKQSLLGVEDFGVDHDKPIRAKNGEQCWMCPCCAGCEDTGAARAAGCGAPSAAVEHKQAEVKAVRTSAKQATLQSKVKAPQGKPVRMAAESGRLLAAAAFPEKTQPAAKDSANKTVKRTDSMEGVRSVQKKTEKQAHAKNGKSATNEEWKEDWLPDQAGQGIVDGKNLQMKRGFSPEKEEDGGKEKADGGEYTPRRGRGGGGFTPQKDDERPISDNDNRLRDDVKIFEDASYLEPHKYHQKHLTKKIGKHLHEDVIAPWFTGADRFPERTQFNEDGTIKTFKPYEDPVGIFKHDPSHEEPWTFAEGKHWDPASPEAKELSGGETWSTVGDKKLLKGEMTNGDNKKWEDLDDPQWAFQHQFGDWDPEGDKNLRLEWGDGGLAKTTAMDDPNTNIFHEPAMTGNKPWELTFMDPRLEGDDFVKRDDYLKSIHPEFKNPTDNQFAHLDEESKDNEDLVFGDNEGTSPEGAALVKHGKDDPAALRQRIDVPVNDNWNIVSDSKINSDTAKDLLVDHTAAVMPLTGEPLSGFVSLRL
jgi:hypothetical protein